MHSNSLIMLGVILAVAGFSMNYLGAVLNVDVTPPTWVSSVPSGGVAYAPSALLTLSITCLDAESDIQSAIMVIDGTQNFQLSKASGASYAQQVWSKTHTFNFAEGSHTFRGTVYNFASLQTIASGSFTVQSIGLAGSWYINTVLVYSSSQTVWSQTALVGFKFLKTAGSASDSQISCYVKEGGTEIVKLANSASATWTGSYTFASGSHTLSLEASDGISSPVVMAVVGLDFGDSNVIWPFLGNYSALQLGMMAAGAALIGYGFITRKKVS